MKFFSSMSQHFLKIILPVHILVCILILLISINWYLVFIGWILISGLGIAIGFHRYLSHKSFITNKFWYYILTILGCFGGQGSPIFWVALHRGNHHKHTDTLEDIHSPVNGIFNSYIGWQIWFDPKKLPIIAAKDLMKNKFMLWIHIHYNKLIWFTISSFSIFDISITLSFLLLPMIISMHQENLINLFCHNKIIGYRNNHTADNSVNIWLMGILFWGHGYHNNHHAYPGRYNYGLKWWEIDPSVFFINRIKSYD